MKLWIGIISKLNAHISLFLYCYFYTTSSTLFTLCSFNFHWICRIQEPIEYCYCYCVYTFILFKRAFYSIHFLLHLQCPFISTWTNDNNNNNNIKMLPFRWFVTAYISILQSISSSSLLLISFEIISQASNWSMNRDGRRNMMEERKREENRDYRESARNWNTNT